VLSDILVLLILFHVLLWFVLFDILVLLPILFQVCWFGLCCPIYWYYC
jgi:hypothetical protein